MLKSIAGFSCLFTFFNAALAAEGIVTLTCRGPSSTNEIQIAQHETAKIKTFLMHYEGGDGALIYIFKDSRRFELTWRARRGCGRAGCYGPLFSIRCRLKQHGFSQPRHSTVAFSSRQGRHCGALQRKRSGDDGDVWGSRELGTGCQWDGLYKFAGCAVFQDQISCERYAVGGGFNHGWTQMDTDVWGGIWSRKKNIEGWAPAMRKVEADRGKA